MSGLKCLTIVTLDCFALNFGKLGQTVADRPNQISCVSERRWIRLAALFRLLCNRVLL